MSVGLAWFVQQDNGVQLHHECIQGSNCLPHRWTKHDGVSFGQQTVRSTEGKYCACLTLVFVCQIVCGCLSAGQHVLRIKCMLL